MTALENSIADSMDEAMQPYITSDEYRMPRTAINQKLTEFRSTLNDSQQRDFNRLLDMINDADADFASKAYVYGAVNGIALREQVLRP